MAKKKPEKPAIPIGDFTVGGEDYKFVIGRFKIDGKMMTKEEALLNEDILLKLVQMRSGVIRQVF